MTQSEVAELLGRLRTDRASEAWSDFLNAFSDLIYKTAHLVTNDEEMSADCYLYACEELIRNNFKRLLRFRPEGPAKFETWLRAVVRNLCIDWQRREFGRERIFQCIAQLSSLDQEIFTLTYFRGLTVEHCLAALAGRFPQLTLGQIEGSQKRIASTLTPKQTWLLHSRRPTYLPLEDESSTVAAKERPQIPDAAPGPDQLTEARQLSEALAGALKTLAAPDRLLVKLRYVQGLTLQEVADAVGLKDAQSADRALRDILARLRKDLHEFA